jgi:hypothetical protein
MKKILLSLMIFMLPMAAIAGELYIGISAGNTQLDTPNGNANGTAFIPKIGYMLESGIGLEISRSDMGDDALTGTSESAAGVTLTFLKTESTVSMLDVVFKANIVDNWYAVGKIGIADVENEGTTFATLTTPEPDSIVTDTGHKQIYDQHYTALHTYVGILYEFDDTFAVNFGADYSEGGDSENILTTTAGVTVSF